MRLSVYDRAARDLDDEQRGDAVVDVRIGVL